jgi:hypothetical protein
VGATNCAGKALAWRQMLMVTSTLIKKFEMRFAEGFTSRQWSDSLHGYFVTKIGSPLLITLSRR